MSHAQRELERIVTAEVYDLGARPIDKGHDGAGHQTITIERHGQQLLFHYPCTTTMNGCTRKNIISRLRRIVRAIPEPVLVPTTPRPQEPAPPVSVSQIETRPLRPPPPTPPRSARMNREKRKDIAKRYLSLPSVDALLVEFPMPRTKLEAILLSQRGQASDKFRSERSAKRMAAARALREATAPAEPSPPPMTREERDRQIEHLYMYTATTLKEIGRRFGVSTTTVWRIAHR